MENQPSPNAAGAVPALSSDLFDNLFRALTYSEWDLIVFMENEHQWQPPAGVTPPPDLSEYGNIEFGTMLFLLHNHNYIQNTDVRVLVDLVIYPLLWAKGLPPSYITTDQYNSLQNCRDVYSDGSLIATSLFALFDQNWIIALCNFILTMKDSAFYNNYQLPLPYYTTPLTITPWNPANNRFTVAMLADWGTGTGEAVATLNYALLQVPDCIIHLGDVYYAGTPVKASGLPDYVSTDEEIDNFLNLWPSGWSGRSFTLNSNHEMYCGANGLFQDVLVPSSPFAAQGATTIFAIQVGDWTLLGLDSAYYADPGELFMYGSLVSNPSRQPDQIAWIKSLHLNPAKTIVLTHHNALDFNCDPTKQAQYNQPFWSQVNEALGGDPYAWYWGHLHNGIVYTSPVSIKEGLEWTTNTYCRCLGNGAIPYGTASELVTAPSVNIEWFAGKGEPVQELQNGYVVLDFELNGEIVSSVSESFYIAAESVFSKTIFQA
jgi:hypothetical protein